jgi:hypothetical protein
MNVTREHLASAGRRAIAVTLALAVETTACSDLFNPQAPIDAPGVPVTGLGFECPSTSDCMRWSADSKTLYLVTQLAAPLGASLVAVDPATHAFRRIGSIDGTATALALSPDDTAMYFSVAADTTRTGYDIYRMSLADGATTTVTKAGFRSISLVSPDGSALAFHALGSSSAADTIVLLDLASGARRATTVVVGSELAAFSSDGTQLLMRSGLTDPPTIQIWHVTTGARDMIPSGAWAKTLVSLRWSGGRSRALFFVNAPGPIAYTDTTIGGGPATTYTATRHTNAIAWVPDRSAVFLAIQSAHCYGTEECVEYHFELVYTTATRTTSLGTVNGSANYPFRAFAASPDGRWLAHATAYGHLYLLNNPQP